MLDGNLIKHIEVDLAMSTVKADQKSKLCFQVEIRRRAK
jgi:hypothetical protein